MPSVICGGRRPKSGIVYTCMFHDRFKSRKRMSGTVLLGNVLLPGIIAQVFRWTQVNGYLDAHSL